MEVGIMMSRALTFSFRALMGIASLLAVGPALGDEPSKTALVPLPSVLDFTRGDGFGVALGAGVEYENAYDGADEHEFGIEPAGAVHYRKGDHLFFWEGFELGWRSRLAEIWLVQTGARYEGGLEPEDSEDGNLDGIEPRDSHVVGFLEVRRGLDPDWNNWVATRLLGGPSGFGWLGVVAVGHRFGPHTDGTGTEVYAFSTFGTADFINKDFGVSASDAVTSGLPETSLDAGYRSTGLQLVHRRYVTDKLHVIGQAGVEFYSSDIGDSPIARENYEFELGLSLLWHF
jgi:outer membrane protein